MSAWMIAVLVVAGCALFGISLVASLRKVTAKLTTDALGDPAAIGAIATGAAVLVGIRAADASRLRGNGVLAVFADRVLFVQAMPRRTVEIPLAAVTEVEVSKVLRMPGRRVRSRREWLVLRWSIGADAAVAGFSVTDPHRWADTIGPGGAAASG